MKIRLMSDLHLEFANYRIPAMEDDKDTVLVLAGDIHLGLRAKNWIASYADKFRAIVYVLGNHEFYNNDIVKVIDSWSVPYSVPSNVHVLTNEIKHIGDVAFIGTPLWTDLNHGDYFAVEAARRGVNDFEIVKYADQPYNPQIHMFLHEKAKHFVNTALEKTSGKKVVVTHYMPSHNAITSRFAGGSLNSFFAANMDSTISMHSPNAWIFGHTHDSIDTMFGDTRIVCNPRGYSGHELNDSFDPFKVIEV
jgi:Icc-related predicted phosphoesterase